MDTIIVIPLTDQHDFQQVLQSHVESGLCYRSLQFVF